MPEDRQAFGVELNAFAERYYGSDIARKGLIYLAEYDRLFSPMRDKPIRLLELGVRFGASMLMWRDYFPAATIVGLDIDPCPPMFPAENRIHFVQGSQADPSALDQAIEVAGGLFDIIIDDASHVGQATARSFAHLFPRGLQPGGFYVIEDICTAFWVSQFPDAEAYHPAEIGEVGPGDIFPSHQNGMVGVVKQIFDHVMYPIAAHLSSPSPGVPDNNRYAIERMLILMNIAILQKASG